MVYIRPGVYIEETSTLPPSVAEVHSSIPAFVGYTEKSMLNVANDLQMKPTKISSILEYEQYFGGPQSDYGLSNESRFHADVTTLQNGSLKVVINEPRLSYLLYYAIKMYFHNGGGQCYVVSVGTYNSDDPEIALSTLETSTFGLMDGLQALEAEDEPTLLVIPEATQLALDSEYQQLVQAMLSQSSNLKDRFAILDLRGGASELVTNDTNISSVADNNSLLNNRSLFGAQNLQFGAAYYPFLKTQLNYFVRADKSNVHVTINNAETVTLGSIEESDHAAYKAIKFALKKNFVTLPPSSTVAGVYVATDTNRGVWKAPANVGLNNVSEPAVNVDEALQQDLNIEPVSGKSINAIRSFPGRGILIWGARTLAGNDNEWRYIPVRRFLNVVEESIKKSAQWAQFETNDANTWTKLRTMIENYLTSKWRNGALAGSKPEHAFYVRCGLGTTMTAQDILENRLIVEIGMAVIRPAEFIIFKFSLQISEEQTQQSFSQKITTTQTWNDLLLPAKSLQKLSKLRKRIKRFQHHSRDPRSTMRIAQGFSSMFSGPSGTGKTMAASLLGKDCNCEVHRVDLSMVISNYIGETEKNLEKLFARAEKKHWILFFDEADALFGKRTNVKTAHNRYANQEVSYLLKRIESFKGVLILATTKKWSKSDRPIAHFKSSIKFLAPKMRERKL